ncbi:MAG: hypothetical protein K8R88_13925, partial [Armatimonadetes bacterium]|nr:hypothetical protein [Armatimonadota bacterium]
MAVSIRKSKHRGPLSATVFLRRNVAKTAPLTLVIILAVMLIAGIVAMMNSIPLSIRTIYGYMKLHTGITGRSNPLLIPLIKEQVLKESPVPLERLITCRVADGRVQSIVGKWPFAVLALNPEDTTYYLERMEMTSLTGRLPEGDKAEAIISEPVARSLEKGIGDSLLSPSSDDMYSANEVKIVGIAKTSNYVMLIPLAYHQKWHFPPIDVYLAFAKTPADQETLDKWALKKFTKQGGRVFSYADVSSDSEEMFKILYKVLNIVIGVLVVVITIMMAMLMNIYQSQRVQEFGLL